LTRRAWSKAALGGATAPLLATLVEACAPRSAPPAPSTDAAPATVQFYFGTAGAPEIQLYTTLKEGFEKQYPKYKMDLLPA
jgi:ABC-type glycerol-3-phosphate transport system substrate-binding protein